MCERLLCVCVPEQKTTHGFLFRQTAAGVCVNQSEKLFAKNMCLCGMYADFFALVAECVCCANTEQHVHAHNIIFGLMFVCVSVLGLESDGCT